MSVLEIRELVAGVAGREILHGIDLSVEAGTVHAVMGPNGSGKSTLAHVLMGRPGYTVLGGSATLDGVDLLELAPWERSRAGLFLGMQDPIEVPGVSAMAMLAASTARHATAGDLGAILDAEATRVGYDVSLLSRSLNLGLSGGERKRNETVQLAALRPRIAVLDEVDSGLDVDALRGVSERVEAATEEWGLGVLAITHWSRLLDVLRADVVHVMADGRIVANGGPELASELEETGYAAYGQHAGT
ncbi:MAG: Fe-S cluster assembly ATPase SufC [Actinomycetota bacterium]|nr:Fe-S cluster assembly ATPase SufC [Actinomycetota bacterium]